MGDEVKKLKRSCIALALLGFATSASATLLTWSVQGTGADGSVATGFLELDVTTSAVGDFDIKVSGGGQPLLTDFEFTPTNTNVLDVAADGTVSMQTAQPTLTVDRFLLIDPVPAAGFTDAGGTVSVFISDTRVQGSTEFPINLSRSFSGVATTAAVPEPGALAFIALGVLSLMGAVKRRVR